MFITKLIRPTIISFLLILVFLIFAYLVEQRWVYYVGIPISLIVLWLFEISQYVSPMDNKAYKEAREMVLKKKITTIEEKEPLVVPKAPENLNKIIHDVFKEEEQPKQNDDISKIMFYKAEMRKIDNHLLALAEDKKLIEEKYNVVEKQEEELKATKKQLRDKLIEVL